MHGGAPRAAMRFPHPMHRRAAGAMFVKEAYMRALFVGGTVDNSELDLDQEELPTHYPSETGGSVPRYRLYEVGERGGEAVYAVYAAPGMGEHEVERIIQERDYPRRFGADQRAEPRSGRV